MTRDASMEEVEETMRLREHLRRRRRRCVYRPKESMTMMVASAEEDCPEDSETATESSAEDEK